MIVKFSFKYDTIQKSDLTDMSKFTPMLAKTDYDHLRSLIPELPSYEDLSLKYFYHDQPFYGPLEEILDVIKPIIVERVLE